MLAAAVHSVFGLMYIVLAVAVQVTFVYGSAVCCAILKLCWLQQCTLFCYFVCCSGCGSAVLLCYLGVSVSWLQLQSVVLVFVLAVAVSVFSTLGLVYIVLAEAVLLWGVNFLVMVVAVQSGVLF